MIALACLWRGLIDLLLALRSDPRPFTLRQRRLAGLWWKWVTDRRARERLVRIGWDLVPQVYGGAEGVASYLRLRVVNPRALNFADGFDVAGGAAMRAFTSIGTDATGTITRWNQVAGAWSIAANLVTAPATVAALMTAGNSAWGDSTFAVRFKWTTGSSPMIVIHCDGTDTNWIGARVNGATIFLDKVVAGVFTNGITSSAAALVNGTFYWLVLQGSGTSYTATVYNDASAAGVGVLGSTIKGINAAVADASVQTGIVGLRSAAAVTYTYGGAFTGACTVSAPLPDGWAPVVTTGEPAFAFDTNPQAGVHNASIFLAVTGDSGSLQKYTSGILAGTNTLACQIQANPATITANASGGGLTTGNGGTAYALQSATGAMAANPLLSLNATAGGVAGRARFDALAITIDPTVAVITDDLPHPHKSTWTVTAMVPGNPSTVGVGSFTVPLFAPGSEQYAAAKAIYDKLDYYQRVEAYVGLSSEGIGLGRMKFAGVITGISRGRGDRNQIIGMGDLQLLALMPTFPGELVPNVQTSAIVQGYMGLIEAGAMDAFNPYTASKYLSTHFPPYTAGAWAAATQDGMPVVSCSTGTGAALLSQTGGVAQDSYHTVYIEATGTLIASNDAVNAGKIGIGLSGSPLDCNTSILGYVIAKKNANGRWDLDAKMEVFANGTVLAGPFTAAGALVSVDEPGGTPGAIPITIGLLMSFAGTFGFVTQATLIVNGQSVLSQEATGLDPANLTNWPFLFSGTPASGAATAYLTNLVQLCRYTGDSHPTSGWFIPGTITGTSNGAQVGNAPGPTFLDMMVQAATREGFYLRYTPTPWVAGTRTLGTVDFSADPGADLTASCIFSEPGGNLDGLQVEPNADPTAAGTTALAGKTAGSGGLAHVRSLPAMFKYGPIHDQTLAVTAYGFPALRRIGAQTLANKVLTGLSGAKKAFFLRDGTADVWRELDRVTVDDPEVGASKQSMRVLQYSFTEGEVLQPVTLDQFSATDAMVLAKRNQQALFQVASQFASR